MEFSNKYILAFTFILCLVCAMGVSATAVGLKDRQDANQLLYKQKNVLLACGAMQAGESITPEKVAELFGQINQIIIDRKTGAVVEGDADALNPRKMAKDPETSEPTPKEFKGTMVKRVPDQLLAYEVKIPGKESIVLPIRGNGLWSTLLGFLALSPDGQEVRGITFYDHGETPGLGGEIDNPTWKALWPGKKAFDENGKPAVKVVKGGSVQNPDFEVDGISGATITSVCVSNLVTLWLGDYGYGPYLETKRNK